MNTLRAMPQLALRPLMWRAPTAANVVLTGILAGAWAAAIAQTTDAVCGNPFVNGFGPHDYRVVESRNRKMVEDYHFTPRVETLVAGQSGSLGGDLDYTLRAIPNHHRALIAMMNLGAKLKSPTPTGAQFSVECYFTRALMFRPDDSIARMFYAKYLASNARTPEAVSQLEYTAQSAQGDGFTQYNVGLIYFEMGQFDKALHQAHRAFALGFERAELKQHLQRAGKWADPPLVGPASAGSATTSGAPAASSASEPAR
jgi:hypothetical protein